MASSETENLELLKKKAAEKAVEQVEDGMILGLGSGSTTRYAIKKLGELWQAGQLKNVVGVPTSEKTAELARSYGLPLGSLDDYDTLDLAIDGADEVDPDLQLIKGLGGALLREKMTELITARFVVIVDHTKLVSKLGTHSPLPVEVTQFGWRAHARWLGGLGCRPELRGGEADPFVTDNSNYILDCHFPTGIDHPAAIAATLTNRPGIVEHGLFLGMADEVIVADKDAVRALSRS